MSHTKTEEDSPEIIFMHKLFGALLKKSLTPEGIEVQENVEITTKIDLELRPKKHKNFTKKQRLYLADGLASSKASRLLIEFKYTESFGESALDQILSYLLSYRRVKKLDKKDVAGFPLCSKTPWENQLKKFGYFPSDKKGVFYSKHPKYSDITLLSLNDLSDEAHNLPLKCFAKKKNVRHKILKLLKNSNNQQLNLPTMNLMFGILEQTLTGEIDMNDYNITPEYFEEVGRCFLKNNMHQMPIENRLDGLTAKEVLQQYDPKEVLQQYNKKEILDYLKTIEQ